MRRLLSVGHSNYITFVVAVVVVLVCVLTDFPTLFFFFQASNSEAMKSLRPRMVLAQLHYPWPTLDSGMPNPLFFCLPNTLN